MQARGQWGRAIGWIMTPLSWEIDKVLKSLFKIARVSLPNIIRRRPFQNFYYTAGLVNLKLETSSYEWTLCWNFNCFIIFEWEQNQDTLDIFISWSNCSVLPSTWIYVQRNFPSICARTEIFLISFIICFNYGARISVKSASEKIFI